MDNDALNVVRHACFGVAGYLEKTSEELAAALNAPATLRPVDLETAMAEAVVAGAAAADFTAIWTYPNWLDRLERGLTNGDYVDISLLLQTRPISWSAETDAAVTTVIAARVLTLAQAKAVEQDVDADLLVVVTADDVAAALALGNP